MGFKMTDILPPAGWPNVRQLETNEFATGGANGNMNEQAKSLAARSELLKQYAALPYKSKTGGYALNERIQLETGDIVRSTIASNVNNPNENMTGWVLINDSAQLIFKARALNSTIRSVLDRLGDTLSVKDFGAKGDGVADDTAAIQKAINYAQTLADSRQLPGVGLFNTAFPNIVFPKGYYKITSTLSLEGNRTFSIGSEDKAVIFGEGDTAIDLFTGTHVWKLYVKGLTFFNFNKVFNITSSNLDFAKWYFTECQVQRANLFVDAGSYALSRSTSVVFDRCDSQYAVKQFARLFCDTVSFSDCWLSLTGPGQALVYGNSLFSFKGCAFLPPGGAKGVGSAFIHLTDDNGAGGTVFDKNRGVTIDSCRLSNEGGNPPLVVADYATPAVNTSNGGPLISISNMVLIGFHPTAYELNGTETGVVQILKYPEAIAFSNCTFDALGNSNSYLAAKNSTLTVEPHNRFNIWLDAPSKRSAADSANSYAATAKIADSLRGFINNPDPAIFRNILEFGYIPVKDSDTEGTKKATLKLKTGWSGPLPGVTPITFMLILTGQDRYNLSSSAYAGSSVYIVSLTSVGGGFGVRNKIQATKLHGPAFSYGSDANADIVSIHFGVEDTGIDVSALAAEQTVTITFGANIRYGKAKIINYIERDGFYANKPYI